MKFIIVPYLIKALMLLITMTCRVRWHDKQILEQSHDSEKPSIVGFWHNCSTFLPWALRDRGYYCMVSASRDGEFVARLGGLFGNHTVRGSTSKGSSSATRKILKLLRRGHTVALTPDGPRGPRYKVQQGILFLAAASQAPIMPVHLVASRQWVLNSWDKHIFPKPFSTIHVGVGQLSFVTKEDLANDPARVEQRVEHAMMENVQRLLEAAGQLGSETK